jgi:hypothetical protein
MECSKTETVNAINLVLSIFVYKLTDKRIQNYMFNSFFIFLMFYHYSKYL